MSNRTPVHEALVLLRTDVQSLATRLKAAEDERDDVIRTLADSARQVFTLRTRAETAEAEIVVLKEQRNRARTWIVALPPLPEIDMMTLREAVADKPPSKEGS